jgi:hypothetical protein
MEWLHDTRDTDDTDDTDRVCWENTDRVCWAMATLADYNPDDILEALEEAGAPAAVVVAARDAPRAQAFALISAFASSGIDMVEAGAPALLVEVLRDLKDDDVRLEHGEVVRVLADVVGVEGRRVGPITSCDDLSRQNRLMLLYPIKLPVS